MSSRDVYLPAGQWRDFWDSPAAPSLPGRQWLKNYPAPLLEKPVLVFERIAD
jgi:alpha-glucosidase (family GH31 glycosyl hydrolase)